MEKRVGEFLQYDHIPRNARSNIFVEVKSGGPWIIIPHGSMGTRSDMQLTSEPTEKSPVGAVAAFETLGAVNRSASLVRTKTTTLVCICEAPKDGTRSNWARCHVRYLTLHRECSVFDRVSTHINPCCPSLEIDSDGGDAFLRCSPERLLALSYASADNAFSLLELEYFWPLV